MALSLRRRSHKQQQLSANQLDTTPYSPRLVQQKPFWKRPDPLLFWPLFLLYNGYVTYCVGYWWLECVVLQLISIAFIESMHRQHPPK